MRLSQAFGKTLRDAPADAEMISHQLLIRANFVRPAGAGIYTFMPLGYRVMRKIWGILAEEMDAIGARRCGCLICTRQHCGRPPGAGTRLTC
jgi:prolyl-tRNA synthetase